MSDFTRVILLQDYNTRIVVFGVMCLGAAAGVIGTFLLLRRRSLTADALSHATLPGIALAFIIGVALGGDGKGLPALLLGAFLFGLLGVGGIILIRNTTRIKDDAALGIVLSVFFGLGMSLVKIAEQMPGGSAAGLDRFILGRAASMIAGDAMAILVVGILVTIACALLFKEFRLLCFDQSFAASQGLRVWFLDSILMGLVVAVTVIGLQAVGLVLIIALLITPAAAARFWTDRLPGMTIIAAVIGGVSGYLGAMASAIFPRLPTGPIIVLVCAAIFLLSLFTGVERGLLVRIVRRVGLTRRVGMQHLLRAFFELNETRRPDEAQSPMNMEVNEPIRFEELKSRRSWSERGLRRLIRRAAARGYVRREPDGRLALTDRGLAKAQHVVRNHRLWELYLIHYADVAPSHVDRDADEIEHILPPELIARLDQLLMRDSPALAIPGSPHALNASGSE